MTSSRKVIQVGVSGVWPYLAMKIIREGVSQVAPRRRISPKREREIIALIKAGLSPRVIAGFSGISYSTLDKYKNQWRREGKLPVDWSTKQKFARPLTKWWELRKQHHSPEKRSLLKLLERLFIYPLLDECEEDLTPLENLFQVEDGYGQLLQAVFGRVSLRELLEKELAAWADSLENPPSSELSRSEFKSILAGRVSQKIRQGENIIPPLTMKEMSLVDQVVDTLTEREAEVIRFYFGLGTESLSLEKIGQRLGLQGERIRQIKEKTVARLRHPRKISHLTFNLAHQREDNKRIRHQVDQLEAELNEVRKQLWCYEKVTSSLPIGEKIRQEVRKELALEGEEEPESLLCLLAKLPVNEFELSTRTVNCLRRAGIRYIGELIQKTESEMLKYRNFGQKSLNELRGILADLGLEFGMEDRRLAFARRWFQHGVKTNDPFDKFFSLWTALIGVAQYSRTYHGLRSGGNDTDRKKILDYFRANSHKVFQVLQENRDTMVKLAHRRGTNYRNPIVDSGSPKLRDKFSKLAAHYNQGPALPQTELVETMGELLNKIRNNLFHGVKIYDDREDIALLNLVNPVLVAILRRCESL